MTDVDEILIVGGGIAGLTLATALSQRGLRAELVERETSWQAIGAGIAVQPNAMRVLRRLGLGDAVERAGAVIRRWRFCDARGDQLCETDLEALWGGVGPFVGIERRALHQALRAGAAAVPSRLGVSVASLAAEPDGVRVRFSDGREAASGRGGYSRG